MRIHILVLTVCALAAPAFSAHAEGPPLEDGWYVQRGACPGELCMFGNWGTRRDTTLYDRPFGDRAVGTARIGEVVAVETAIDYLRPLQLTVIHAVDYGFYDWKIRQSTTVRLEIGDTLYLLTNEGEGYRKAWLDGRIVSVDASQFMDFTTSVPEGNAYKSCDTPSPKCWWRTEGGEIMIRGKWWVKMALPDGTVGWTSENRNFLNEKWRPWPNPPAQ